MFFTSESDLDIVRRSYCGYEVLEAAAVPTGWYTVYHTPGLRFPLQLKDRGQTVQTLYRVLGAHTIALDYKENNSSHIDAAFVFSVQVRASRVEKRSTKRKPCDERNEVQLEACVNE